MLVGFLLILIAALLVLMQEFSDEAQRAVLRRWEAAADAASESLSDATSPSDLRLRAEVALTRYEILSIGVTPATGERLHVGSDSGAGSGVDGGADSVDRGTKWGIVHFAFDQGDLEQIQSRFAATASISVAAAVTGMFLLILFIPRITRPIEEMLDQAREVSARDGQQDDTTYLLETFRESIQRLKTQEAELKRLHESEKSRADELELVSATLTRSLTSGFIALDPSARVLQMNAAAREILGIAPDQPVQLEVGELLSGSRLATVLRDAVRSGETMSRIEVEHESLSIGLTAVPLLGENERLLGMLALFTDLTPIKRLESRVRAMQTLAELGEIAAGIAHEFRNSLSTILGYLKLLQRNDLPGEAAGRVRAAETEATQLTAAVERLLTFARPMTLQLDAVDLQDVATDVVERLNATGNTPKIEVRGTGRIQGDRALLSRAVDNVVRNAVDAVGHKGAAGVIEIDVENDPPAIVVRDNGVGLDDADAARLLLPFVSNKPGGFGLGLSLARKIAVLHGGEIALHGAPGRGAIVTMTFPPAE